MRAFYVAVTDVYLGEFGFHLGEFGFYVGVSAFYLAVAGGARSPGTDDERAPLTE